MEPSERRAHYLARFEAWLDQALQEESLPTGIAPEVLTEFEGEGRPGKVDLYTVLEALTALTQEVRLQGRAFRGLADPLPSLLGRVDDIARYHGEALGEARRIALEAKTVSQDADSARAEQAEQQFLEQSLDLLLDLRDRLSRGIATAEALVREAQQPPGPRAFLWPRAAKARLKTLAEAVGALLDGHRLTLDHLEDALRSHGVSVIPCLGHPFEPGLMSAIDVIHTSDVPDGSVVDVYRPGYECNGRVLRPAQVKVARNPAGPGRGDDWPPSLPGLEF